MLTSRMAIVLAGLAAGTVARLWKARQDRQNEFFERSVTDLYARLGVLEKRINEHEVRLKEVPGASQIATTTEELLSKTMRCLDDRFGTQASSIQVLTQSVSQTDELLKRVLQALERMRAAESPLAPALR